MKNVMLGTAMWGWSVDERKAFQILDFFYDSGGTKIDTANNYPINGDPKNLQFAVKILSEWMRANKVKDLNITLKVGSVTNEKSSINDLSLCYLKEQHQIYSDLLERSLKCFMIHWDNRRFENEIKESLKIIPLLANENQVLGLSGIKHPSIYEKLLSSYSEKIEVQVKQNFLNNGINHYRPLLTSKYDFWAYGIACSGLKLNKSEYRKSSYVCLARSDGYHDAMLSESYIEKINRIFTKLPFMNNLYHLGLVVSELNESLKGYIIAPSSVEQLQDIIEFKAKLNSVKIEKEMISEVISSG